MSAQADSHSKPGCSLENKNNKSKYQSTNDRKLLEKGHIKTIAHPMLVDGLKCHSTESMRQQGGNGDFWQYTFYRVDT